MRGRPPADLRWPRCRRRTAASAPRAGRGDRCRPGRAAPRGRRKEACDWRSRRAGRRRTPGSSSSSPGGILPQSPALRAESAGTASVVGGRPRALFRPDLLHAPIDTQRIGEGRPGKYTERVLHVGGTAHTDQNTRNAGRAGEDPEGLARQCLAAPLVGEERIDRLGHLPAPRPAAAGDLAGERPPETPQPRDAAPAPALPPPPPVLPGHLRPRPP